MDNIIQLEGFAKRKYFSFEERKILEKLCGEDRYQRSIGEKGISMRSMAKILGRVHSTIKEELKRLPRYEFMYSASWAHRDYLQKQANKGNIRKLDRDIVLRSAVIEGILGDKSPEQISKRIKKLWTSLGIKWNISHETIYSFIYSDREAKEKELYNHLRRHRKNRRKQWVRRPQEKFLIKERTSIHERPEYINTRRDFWHFETDSVIFSQGKAILSVQYERKSSLARITKLKNKTALETARALRSLVYEFDGPYPVRSVTYDNGSENVLHTELIHEYWIVTYFADTYSSWQKWGVENLNGLIRQYLPRHIDFESLSDEDIYVIQEKLNNRPRKRLKWLTPNEYYAKITWQDCTIRKLFP